MMYNEYCSLGALLDDKTDSVIKAAFTHGVNMVNDDRSILARSRLIPDVENKAPSKDSFGTSKKRKST